MTPLNENAGQNSETANNQEFLALFESAKSLGKQLQNSAAFQDFKAATEKMQNDTELQKNLFEFNSLRVDAGDLVYKTDSESRQKYDNLNEKIKNLYEKIWSNPRMVDFNLKNGSLLDLTQKLLNIVTIASDGVDLDDTTAHDENFLTPQRNGLAGCQPGQSCNSCTVGCTD